MPSPRVHTPGKSRFAPPSSCTPPRPTRSHPLRSNKVRVVVRVRPFLPSDFDDHPPLNPVPCVFFSKGDGSDDEATLHLTDSNTSRQGSYKLDCCYGETDDISLIFANELEPILPGLFRGYNATVFAYGATGSGKTYTMQGLENCPGLIPLALMSILDMSQHSHCVVEVAYYEVYMDRCYDLLETRAAEVSVLEGNDGKIQLRGLSQVPVKTLAEFREVFQNGCLRRKVAQTGLNDASSRSHGVLMLTVTSYDHDTGLPVVGKLNLIDLAGNEDNRRTGNEGTRLAESARINQSLFVLSNVINALNSNETRVPYRDSKLTRILQDSLGGKSQALMIACLSPKSYQEATHTLNLAARSRQIMNQSAQDDHKEGTHMKIDMETKLQAWLEAKGKGPPITPCSWKVKSLFYTPSRHHINRLRKIDGNLVRDPCATPKARRVLVPSLPSGVHKGDANHQEQNLSNAAADKSEPTQTLSDSISGPSGDESVSCYSQSMHLVEVPTNAKNFEERPTQETSAGSEVQKETYCQELFTPRVDIMSGSSSPPLSERLRSLRSAMKDILQPISNNVPLEEKEIAVVDPSTNAKIQFPSPKSFQMNSPKFLSPEKTPTQLSGLETSATGTPLERFSKNSSGIKSTLMKEYLDFLNTASREELLQVKGIGEKRAAYILSLREFSPEPLKELEDLQRAGFSKKQALSLFKDTARQIF